MTVEDDLITNGAFTLRDLNWEVKKGAELLAILNQFRLGTIVRQHPFDNLPPDTLYK